VNPANPTDEKPFLGLTAQTLYVLDRVPFSIDKKSQRKVAEVKRFLLRTASEWAKGRLNANDRMHDADRYLYPTQYVTEGSTFLWYPWCVGLTRSLSTDPALTEKERRMAANILKQLRARRRVWECRGIRI
jgi:hypothetical protein